MRNDTPTGRYVDKARDRMQSYVRDLLRSNEDLRMGLAATESDNERLRQEIRSLHDELDLSRTLQNQLDQKMQEIRAEGEAALAEFVKMERTNANLANLYVASYQLHSTLERQSVLAAIQEIIVNLIGSEEFAVFSRDEAGSFLLAIAMGVEEDDSSILAHERVAASTSSGETWVSAHQGDLTACIPLKIDDAVTGFIVIRRLLSHKAGLEPLDLELFDLLGTHAAMALYASALHERVAGEALAV